MNIEQRLAELKAERDRGRQMAINLQSQLQEVQMRMLRIEGAIAILQEQVEAPEEELNGDP